VRVGFFLHLILPAALAPAYALVLARAWTVPLDLAGTAVAVAGGLAVYLGDRVIERGKLLGRRWRIATGMIAAAAVAVVVIIALRQPQRLLPVLVLLGAIALAYPLLKRIPGGKAPLVGAAWTGAAVLLPLASDAIPWAWLLRPASLAIFLLTVSGTVLCDLKDMADDARVAVRSWPVLFGERVAVGLAAALALLSCWPIALAEAWALLPSALLLLGLAGYRPLLRRSIAGPLAVDAALVLSGVLAWFS